MTVEARLAAASSAPLTDAPGHGPRLTERIVGHREDECSLRAFRGYPAAGRGQADLTTPGGVGAGRPSGTGPQRGGAALRRRGRQVCERLGGEAFVEGPALFTAAQSNPLSALAARTHIE